MSDLAIQIRDLGRMYKLYNSHRAQLLDILGFRAFTRNAYKEFWALRHFDLDVRHGERIGLIGRNGAGKSTLLKIICGRSQATEGSVTMNGQVQALLGIGTGFNNEFTGRENIHSALSLHGFGPAQIKRYEEEIVDFTELEDFIHQPVKYYSAGMYTRLAFAVATALEPEILVIDEVLGAGDAAFVSKCAARMKRITEEAGATVLFVSHSTASVIEICNRAILVEHGRIAADGDPLAITKLYHQRIRAEEELSLKAREYRIRRRDLKNLQEAGDRRRLLFRLLADTPHPAQRHKIRAATLTNAAGDQVALLGFGSPHDNSEYLDNHVLDAYGLNDWGRAAKDAEGTFRYYQDEKGQFCHAPFQLSSGVYEEPHTLALTLKGDVAKGETVHVEWFDGTQYVRLGSWVSGEFHASLPMSEQPQVEADAVVVSEALPENVVEELQHIPEPEEAQAIDPLSIYGSQELRITDVMLHDGKGRERRTFETGERMEFRITLKADKQIPHFVMVLCIYQRDGRPGAQVFATSADLGLDGLDGGATIDAVIDPLRLGAGEYMVSVAAFREYVLTSPRENEAYCVLDRAILFSVAQPHSMQKSIGGFAQPVDWQVKQHCHRYDAAIAHSDADDFMEAQEKQSN